MDDVQGQVKYKKVLKNFETQHVAFGEEIKEYSFKQSMPDSFQKTNILILCCLFVVIIYTARARRQPRILDSCGVRRGRRRRLLRHAISRPVVVFFFTQLVKSNSFFWLHYRTNTESPAHCERVKRTHEASFSARQLIFLVKPTL